MKSCLIIGAGMSGLAAAKTLQAAGVSVTVLDKGRGVGGRIATRRIDDGVFDHGAQFVTARDLNFRKMLEEMRGAGAVYEWCRGIGTPDEAAREDGHPRYQGTGGMSAIPKYLAKGLDVRLRHRVVQIKQMESEWRAQLESGQMFSADALICTAPVPQTMDLLDLGGYEMPDECRSALERIKYRPCLALMALLDGPSQIPEPGAVRDVNDSISFICDNRMKGISPDATAVTIHAGPQFSREHWSVEERAVTDWLLEQSKPYLGSRVRSASLHRWRYAHPSMTHTEPCLMVDGEAPLLFAGDAFNGPRVEGAAISGIAAATALLAQRTFSR